MNTKQHACNYAILRFLPYPETGEFVNVGVLVNCVQTCLLDFQIEGDMPARVKALFPMQDEKAFRDAALAMEQEMKRVKGIIRDTKTCQFAFREVARPRESLLRFGEVRTIITTEPETLAMTLFRRYVRMETPAAEAPMAGV
jgi:hypothetical protein